MSKAIIWIVFGLVVLLVALGVILVAKNDSAQNSETYPITLSATDSIRGATDAKLTLVEYSDFQCPACAAYHPLVKQILNELATSTRFIYRHYPLPQHQNAKLAAYAAEAAGRQGKFFEMLDLIFEHQTEWANSATAANMFAEYARNLGLDLSKFTADLTDPAIEKKVADDVQSGNSYNVNATPTFYLNGKKLQNPAGYAAFKAILQAELK